MSAEVFISYAAKDRTRVLDLVERLRAAGVSVWIDQMGIEGATMWSQEIVAAIRSCKVLILAISENSAGSENVVKEVALASEGRKRILPVYIRQAEIPESMAYQLAGIQRIEFFEGREDAAQQAVIRALAKLGVTVHDEASAAAANTPGSSSHGPSHPTVKAKGEAAVWLKVAAAVVGLAVLGLAGTFFFGSSTTTAPMPVAVGQAQTNTVAQATLDTNRVVVLPFKVIGGAKDSEDLGYGLVSTLTSKLQPLQNLVVIAKESARKFEDSKQSPKEIGQALGAGTLVTGEVQTSNDKIQVNIQLIDANTEALGWGSTFTKAKDEFLDLQNEIATKLASELKGGLDVGEAQQLAQKATENAEAQAEYQAGRREWNKRSKEGFDNAIKHFEKAIELDPNYADPYAGMADTYSLLPTYNFALPTDTMPKAKAYAEQAKKKNPNLAKAYTSLAWVLHQYEYDWKGAEENYRRAAELNPNYATMNHWFGIFLSDIGKHNEAIKLTVKASELDPHSMIIKSTVAHAFLMAEQNTQALKYCDKTFEIDPYFSFALWFQHAKINERNSKENIDHIKEAIRRYPNQPMHRKTLAEVYWNIGDREAAMEQVIELLDRYHDSFRKAHFADLYFVMGKPEQAYRWLEKAIEAKEGNILFYGVLPTLKKYQKEPRFRELYKKINHPLYVD
jgi:TolB-like protein/Flp pilus assembly protein TadD